jgi:hypothetical protein
MSHRIGRNFIRAVSGSAAAIFLVAGSAHAQALFQPLGGPNSQSRTFAAGKTPKGVAIADFNHDGFPDVVVANYADTSLGTSGTISVYLASGPGTFNAPTVYPTCGGPTAVLAEDLGLTGLPDIAVTCNTPTSNVVEVFLNLGNGTFNPTVNGTTNIVIGTGAGPVAITSGDFNSDGHPDLAVADQGDGTVTLLLSNAAVNFRYYTVKTISGLGKPTAITAGRFDASGHLDLAVTNAASNQVNILKGDGTGAFTLTTPQATGANPNGIVTADLNHDGLPDLATVNAGNGTVTVLYGTGNDQFRSSTFRVGPASGTGAESIIALDVNGDGYLDLVSGNMLQSDVAVLLNNGGGGFQAAQDYAVPNGPAYLAAGDFNRSGKPDLVVSQQADASVTGLVNNTPLTPVPGGLNFLAPHILANGHGNMADGIAVADFNGDGKPDLVASYLEDNSVRVLAGSGGGNFQTAVAYKVGKQPISVTTGDLNLDGYADIVTANTADDTISVLLNNGGGTGTFGAAQTYNVGRDPYNVAIGDLNGDGFPDLAVTNIGDNTVTILYGPFNNPAVETMQLLQTCANPYGVAIGDFRHSGQNDVAVTCFGSAQMEVFLNNGMMPGQPPVTPTTFQSPLMYSTGTQPTSIVLGDFNRDGNLDIVTGNAISNNVSFFAGDGGGSFNPNGVTSFALNFPVSIAAGDVNGDGILDLVTVAPNFNQVAILLGKGDGTFLPRMEFATGQQPWATALADFNYDGKLDIALANTVNRVNLSTPAKQIQYMTQFPPTGSGGPSLNVLLNGSGTALSFKSSPAGTAAYDQPVTLSATLKAALGGTTPGGSVSFADSNGMVFPGSPAALNGGTGSLAVHSLGSGTHQITVLYSGDPLYQPRTNTGPGYVVRVGGTFINFTMSPASVGPGGPVTYTAIVGTPGARKADPTGLLSVYLIDPSGGVFLADGPRPVVPSGNGTSTVTNTLTNVLGSGTYYFYSVFTPTKAGAFKPGSSSEVQFTSLP